MRTITPLYRRLAQDALDMAARAKPEHREKLHRIAKIWLSLATEHLRETSRQAKQQPNLPEPRGS
jgi:hypothetical protein